MAGASARRGSGSRPVSAALLFRARSRAGVGDLRSRRVVVVDLLETTSQKQGRPVGGNVRTRPTGAAAAAGVRVGGGAAPDFGTPPLEHDARFVGLVLFTECDRPETATASDLR